MDAMSAPETVSSGQGVLKSGEDLRPAQRPQRPCGGRFRDIEMLGKFWLPRHI